MKAPGIASTLSLPLSSSKFTRSSTATLLLDFSLRASIGGLMRRCRSSTDHSHQNQSPPAGIENDRNPNRDTERGPKMLNPTNCDIQLVREDDSPALHSRLTRGSCLRHRGRGNARATLLPRRQVAA